MSDLSTEDIVKKHLQSQETLDVIHRMEAGLAGNSNAMTDHFTEDFRWMGNYGCGTKHGLKEFRRNWQLPIRAAFTDRKYNTDKFLVDGEWAACFGHIDALHTGPFMGIAATNKRVKIPYMDFWLVRDGRIADNWVSVDFPSMLMQMGKDVFGGQGWEGFDERRITPDVPEENREEFETL